jgi:hypothetical protein
VQAERFEALASELARRHAELPAQLARVRPSAQALREQAVAAVSAFTSRARALGAEHLTDVRVSPVIPDQKHVNGLQFSVERGRHVLLCVALANPDGGKARLVGPFRNGKAEGPCAEHPLGSPELEDALEQRILDLLREACAG